MAPTTLSLRAPLSTCNTPACNALSQTLLSNVNFNIDPCSDFYQFSCGNWQNTDPIKRLTTAFDLPTQTQGDSFRSILSMLNGTFEELTQKIQERETDYLKNKEEVDTDNSNFLLAKNYYDMCLDSKARAALGYTSIFPYVAQIENTLLSTDMEIDPEKMAQVLAVSILQEVPTIIELLPILNPLDHDYRVPLLRLRSFGTDVDYTDINSLNKYRDSLISLLNKALGGPSSEDDDYEQMVIEESRKNNLTFWSSSKINLAVSRFIDFEIQLSNMQNIESPPSDGEDTESENLELPTFADLRNTSSSVSWDTLFETLVSSDYVNSNFSLIFDEAQMTSLDLLLSQTSAKTLQEYIVIQTVKTKSDALKTSTSVSESGTSLVKKLQNIFRAPLSRDPDQGMPEIICAEETSLKFKHIIGRFFAWTSFGGLKEKKEAEEFVDMLHSTWLHDMLPKTSWIGDETKKTIIDKVNVLRKRVVYSTTSPDWSSPASLKKYYEKLTLEDNYFDSLYSYTRWKNLKLWSSVPYKIDRDEWDEGNVPELFNALYSPEENLIEVPIGTFQAPFYNPQYPQYINYGNLGVVIGHEFTHSLDSTGRFYDKNGYKAELFTEADSKTYHEKSQCFIDQFDEFSLVGPDDKVFPLNGTFVLGENIADSGGMRIAYNAYHNLIKKRGSPDQALSGFEKYSAEQLFFVSHAQFTCSILKQAEAQSDVETDEHAPLYFRGIGSFQNSQEFATAFNCPVGSPMNPEKKCSIW